MTPIYKLVVHTQIGTFEVHGPEKELRPIFNDWMNGLGSADEKLVIRGELDNHNSDPVSHCLEREVICGMSLIAWS